MGNSFKYFMATTVAFVMAAAVWEDSRHPDLEASIQVRPFRYSIDTSKPLAQLQNVPGVRNTATPGITLGAVVTNLVYRVQASTTLSGRHTLDISVGYRPATMYVAQEMTRDRCAHRHVLEHESEHVNIFEQEMSRWQAELRQKLAQPGVQAYSAAQLEVAASRWVRDLDERLYARHRLLDNPDEYARNQTVCNGNVRRLAYGEPIVSQSDHLQLQTVTIVGRSLKKRPAAL